MSWPELRHIRSLLQLPTPDAPINLWEGVTDHLLQPYLHSGVPAPLTINPSKHPCVLEWQAPHTKDASSSPRVLNSLSVALVL